MADWNAPGHLVVFTQQQIMGARGCLGICWDTIARWEVAEPVRHRAPLPFPLFLAMMGVGLLWRWPKFVAVLGISFFGISRPGEPLAAVRADLVLPSDRLDDLHDTAYLRVGASKSRRRGRNVIQHLTITDSGFVRFLERVFAGAKPHEALFCGTAAAFRKRWDTILSCLKVPKASELTPGGLRGGGCVFAFQSGIDMSRLLWRMRLKHQATLESYLQEVVASSVIPSLSLESRERFQAASSLASYLLRL